MEPVDQIVNSEPACILEVHHAGRANFALQQNDVPVIREIIVANAGASPLDELQVVATIGDNFAKPWEARISRLEAGDRKRLQKMDVHLDASRLANQLERERVDLNVRVLCGAAVVASYEAPLDVLAFNEWPGVDLLPQILAAFVSPNHPSIEELLGTVRDIVGQTTGDPSLSGYQSSSPDRALAAIGAVYEAMQKVRIGYINPPASYEKRGQKIRTPDQVLSGSKLGTCLDLTVIAAAAIEQAGLHPLLLLFQGHAFVGAWLRDDQFAEPAIDDAARILNRVRLQEIAVFETTALCDGKTIAFADAARSALHHLERTNEFEVAIDVQAARREGILPLPPRVKSGEGFEVVSVVAAAPKARPNVHATAPSSPERTHSRRGVRERKPPPDLCPEAISRLDRWKRKLLDLSMRNPLLNFRLTAKVVPLLVPDVAALEDGLASGRSFHIAAKPDLLDPSGPRDLSFERDRSGRDIPSEVLREEMNRGLLRADLTTDFDRRLVELFRAAKSGIEETGTNTLFLALGTLHFHESPSSQERRVSPLLLVPVKLERPQPGRYRIQILDEETRVNITLIEKLEHDFGLAASPLAQLNEDENGIDVRDTFAGFIQLIKDMPRWEVRETAHLGLFSFLKFLLWADLEQRVDQVAASPVVRYILERPNRPFDLGDFPDEDALDQSRDQSTVISPMDSDSSQQAAVEAAASGKTFVLQGPPGTGKSQTICNLIVRAAFEGKRVLFVAEKMAALSVVQRRLAQLGLAPFILELHSAKAGKREVLEQLRTALDTAASAPPGGWEAEIARLFDTREKLNAYVTALHRKRTSGESVYEAAARLAALETSPRSNLQIPEPAAMTPARLESLRRAVDEASTHAAAVGDPATHPLRGIQATEWRLDLGDQASAAIENALRAASQLQRAVGDWLIELSFHTDKVELLGTAEFVHLTELANLVLAQRCPSRAIVGEAGWDVLNRDIRELAQIGRKRDAARTALLSKYNKEFLSADHNALASGLRRAAASGVLFRWFRRRTALAPLRAMAIGPRLGDDIQIFADLSEASTVFAQTQALCRSDTSAARALGTMLRSGEADWGAVEETAAWAGSLRKQLASYPGSGVLTVDDVSQAILDLVDPDRQRLQEGGPARVKAEAFVAAAKSFEEAADRLGTILHSSIRVMTGQDARSGRPLFAAFREVLAGWSKALPRLAEWAAWQRAFRRDDVPEIRDLLSDLDSGRLRPADAAGAFEATYARIWLSAVMPSDSALQHFTHEGHAHLIGGFREADRKVLDLSRRVVTAKLSCQIPQANTASVNPNSEIGILRRQLALQRNHKPVRRLVKEMPVLLPRLKPVWLMSPLSVAQYLDPAVPPFDLVVFDEASQIPAWDAVGALARGAKVIVVGDSKQLPPTNFFQRQEDSAEAIDDADVEEVESILDECVAAALPELKLKWHYRSRHESLIAFSNHHYYENRLLTFPSADAATSDLGVSMRFLPHGRYDRGGSRTNRAEADAVVAEIFRCLLSGEQRTIGVVTFSSAQQVLIEDLMDEELRKHPGLEPHFSGNHPEPVFVKNLENVQGDERDVILFSICYGPDESGKLSLGFGPLNRDGGERRLNVAVTRAREQLIVFTSIRADQIDLSRSRAKGLKHLQTFLDYAERGPAVLRETTAAGTQADWESPFEMAVCKALREKGWTVETQVGCSGYRIDLGVRDPERPGRYLLGIECDGASYHSAKTARDRDRLREQVLIGLGWRIHRVWSTDWLQNPRRCIERIELALAEARKAPRIARAIASIEPSPVMGVASANPVDRVQSPPTSREGDAIPATERPTVTRDVVAGAFDNRTRKLPPGAKSYICHRFTGGGRSQDLFYASGSSKQIADDLCALVASEGPIHVDRAYALISRAWGLQRITRRVEHRLAEMSERAAVVRRGDFFRARGADQCAAEHFRVMIENGEPPLPLEQISPEEIGAAVLSILKEQFGLPANELEREVARLFGHQRPNSSARQSIQAIVEAMVAAGRCSRDGDMVRA